MVDRQLGNLQPDVSMLIQPQAEGIFDHTRNEGGGLAGR